MSAKASVLNKYPQAMAWQWANGWIIYSKPAGGKYLCPTQKTRKAAWESAAERLNLLYRWIDGIGWRCVACGKQVEL